MQDFCLIYLRLQSCLSVAIGKADDATPAMRGRSLHQNLEAGLLEMAVPGESIGEDGHHRLGFPWM
jgi:hypothetical protein